MSSYQLCQFQKLQQNSSISIRRNNTPEIIETVGRYRWLFQDAKEYVGKKDLPLSNSKRGDIDNYPTPLQKREILTPMSYKTRRNLEILQYKNKACLPLVT